MKKFMLIAVLFFSLSLSNFLMADLIDPSSLGEIGSKTLVVVAAMLPGYEDNEAIIEAANLNGDYKVDNDDVRMAMEMPFGPDNLRMDIDDLLYLLRWGKLPGDLNGDGSVDIKDFIELARDWIWDQTGPSPKDANGDEILDQKDVTRIAELLFAKLVYYNPDPQRSPPEKKTLISTWAAVKSP